MMPTRQGAIRLFRFAGIQVYLHWSWFLFAIWRISSRTSHYGSEIWNVFEYLSIFLIVLLHEFGHSLACRSVGGKADQIILWPLGGVAYVSPPQRPGAVLWSIAAGPLVNVILFPLLSVALFMARRSGLENTSPDLSSFVYAIWFINNALLIFNLLPIYPLDGGQIVRSLLWFVVGRARSLLISSVLGFVGVACLIILAVTARWNWGGVLAVFALMNCWRGLVEARALARIAALPRNTDFACPKCGSSPPKGPLWLCGSCHHRFDTFFSRATCPNCGAQFINTACFDCGNASPFHQWIVDPSVPPRIFQ